MNPTMYQAYLHILEEELVPAMGCTEPIAIAYAAALARKTLDRFPAQLAVEASANIIKNVKSVVVPNTGGQRGIPAAAVAGVVAGDADKELEVLSAVTESQRAEIAEKTQALPCKVIPSQKPYIFFVGVTLEAEGHSATVEIAGFHTNVVRVTLDGLTLVRHDYVEGAGEAKTDHSVLRVEEILHFADQVAIDDVRAVLDRQIAYNTAIAEEGLRGDWGANIGSVLLHAYGDSVHNKAKAYAAAGSDARMNGCELPVVINSGSGNQGLTASLPVIVYAREMGVTQEALYRALVVSNLVTIHLKTGVGRLSAYCGATSAGCGAAAGITYLHGGDYTAVAHTLVNAVAIDSGMICDGAKASCAAKIASAVEAGLLGFQMWRNDQQFYGGDGIVVKGVENTIRNVGELARHGMAQTDRTIVEIMTR